jgi:isoleucyl-tRNA synthetase
VNHRCLIHAIGKKKQGGKGRGDDGAEKGEKNAYATTILLPETQFSLRANAQVREPEIQQFWNSYDLYNKLSTAAEASKAPRFVLHDGPPYANGDLHIGHALNKILKDIINRYQILQGKQVHYVPGWDCHGLPIELKVLQTMSDNERANMTPVDLRRRASIYAKDTVTKQSTSFQRYGIYGDFQKPYLTLDPTFEAAQIGVFGEMFKKGYIFRGRKPVHWSPSSRTALAEAELEYPEGHVSKSIYVAFDVETPSTALQKWFDQGVTDKTKTLKVAIWTTTPWTIPANLAVAVNPALSYAIVDHEDTGKLIVATDLVTVLELRYHCDNDYIPFYQVI